MLGKLGKLSNQVKRIEPPNGLKFFFLRAVLVALISIVGPTIEEIIESCRHRDENDKDLLNQADANCS